MAPPYDALAACPQVDELGECGKRKNARDCNAQCSCFFNGAGQCVPKQLLSEATVELDEFDFPQEPNYVTLADMLSAWGDEALVWLSANNPEGRPPPINCCRNKVCSSSQSSPASVTA